MANCKNHPGVVAAGRCAGCAEEFCQQCLVEIQGQKYCGACKVMALGGKMPEAVIATQESEKRPNPLAKEALTYAIVGLFCIGFVLEPMAIYKAIKARQAIAQDPSLGGNGASLAALIIGIIVLLLNIVVIFGKIKGA